MHQLFKVKVWDNRNHIGFTMQVAGPTQNDVRAFCDIMFDGTDFTFSTIEFVDTIYVARDRS